MDSTKRSLWIIGLLIVIAIVVGAIWGGLVGISVAAVLALVVSLGEIAWQLFKDARWVIRRIRKRPPGS